VRALEAGAGGTRAMDAMRATGGATEREGEQEEEGEAA
jgi:hypothetical protein